MRTLQAETTSVCDRPRFRALSLAANGVGVTMNAAKIVAYGGNPLAANYAQWTSFIRSLFRYTSTELLMPGASTAGLLDQYQLNRAKLADLWDQAAPGEPAG